MNSNKLDEENLKKNRNSYWEALSGRNDAPYKPPLEEYIYPVGGIIFGVITFLVCWIYSIAEYGWFLGVGLGWIPALFIAILVGFMWPLILFGGIIVFFFAQ